jgi:hypothetical protein
VPASLSSPTATSFDQIGDIPLGGGLRERLALVPDPRSPCGLRHSLLSILLITVCALAAGKNGYTAIEAWAKDAPAPVLHALDVRFDAFTARHVCPGESTIRNVISRIDRSWPMSRRTRARIRTWVWVPRVGRLWVRRRKRPRSTARRPR